MDEWGNYPHERQRLFDLIHGAGAEGVLLLSGNVHFAELSRVESGGLTLYDFTSSGLTHVNEAYPAVENPYRVGEPVVELNFGLIEIEWQEMGPVAQLSVLGVDGSSKYTQMVVLADGARSSDTP